MKQTTITKLNQLNQQFYQTIASEFDKTRYTSWQGWQQLVQFFPEDKPLRILDVGCGNARFANFLALQQVPVESYLGIDTNQFLLHQAKVKNFPFPTRFVNHDIIQNLDTFPNRQQYDLIVLFGIMHHIPSFRLRQKLLQNLDNILDNNGVLIFAAWQFLSIPSLKKRVVSWKVLPKIDLLDLETHDYLLDWRKGKNAYRYCHWIDQTEIKKLTRVLQCTKVSQYYADGKNDKSNAYVVLQKN